MEPGALLQTDAGVHSPVGQRHFVACRLKSAPANVQVPCSQRGARKSPRFDGAVSLERGDRGDAPVHATGVNGLGS